MAKPNRTAFSQSSQRRVRLLYGIIAILALCAALPAFRDYVVILWFTLVLVSLGTSIYTASLLIQRRRSAEQSK
jgi:hypothetical protein